MEKIVKYLNCSPEKVEELSNLKKELLSQPIDIQRFVFYEMQNSTYTVNTLSNSLISKYNELVNKSLHRLIETDDKICLCENQYMMRFNTKIYFKSKCTKGLTYDKKTKKIKFWFGSSILENTYIIREYLRDIKCDWFFSMNEYLQTHITKTLLEGIIKRTITNPEDYTKKYMKLSLKYSFHYKLFVEFLNTETFYFRKTEDTVIPENVRPCADTCEIPWERIPCVDNTFFKSMNNYSLNKVLFIVQIKDYTIEPNFALQKIMNLSLSYDYVKTLQDMLNQCRVTGDKINLHWSYKRLQEEHLKLSRKISALKFSHIDKTPVPIFGTFTYPYGIKGKLLDNESEVYIEGDEMHHCVYSNYWNRIKDKNYFVFSITYPERCTMGISREWSKDNELPKFKLDQVYCKMNQPVKPSTKVILQDWINTKEMQNFFFMNYETHKEEDVKTLSELEEKQKPSYKEYRAVV